MNAQKFKREIILTITTFFLIISCSSEKSDFKNITEATFIEVRLVGEDTTGNAKVLTLEGTNERIILNEEVLMNLNHVKNAYISEEYQGSGYRVNLRLTDEGSDRFQDITRENRKKRVGIIVDGVLVCAPRIMAEITGGIMSIYFKLPKEKADAIAEKINHAIHQYHGN